MRLEDVLKEDYVIEDLKATEKREVLDELVTALCSKVEGLDREKVLQALLEREKLGSTGIGFGVAIPHGKVKGISGIKVSFGRSKRGVDFNAMDDRPVHLFFLIVAPENSTVAHLKVLASISNLLKDSVIRKRLVRASSRKEIYSIIMEGVKKH